ncbi:hypothetical protein KR067_000725, partial [Drosophila pandora]
RSKQMENKNRRAGNMMPIEIIDLTGDDEDMDISTASQSVMVCEPCMDFKSYKCPICLQLPREPVSTICGHVFCDQCLNKALGPGVPSCPLCKSTVNREQIIRLYM